MKIRSSCRPSTAIENLTAVPGHSADVQCCHEAQRYRSLFVFLVVSIESGLPRAERNGENAALLPNRMTMIIIFALITETPGCPTAGDREGTAIASHVGFVKQLPMTGL